MNLPQNDIGQEEEKRTPMLSMDSGGSSDFTPEELEEMKSEFGDFNITGANEMGGGGINPDSPQKVNAPKAANAQKETISKVYDDSTVARVLDFSGTDSENDNDYSDDFFGETLSRQLAVGVSSAQMHIRGVTAQHKMNSVINKAEESGKITPEEAADYRKQISSQRQQREGEIQEQIGKAPTPQEGFGDAARTGALVGQAAVNLPGAAIKKVASIPALAGGGWWAKMASVIAGGAIAETPLAAGELIRTGSKKEAGVALAMGPLGELGGLAMAKVAGKLLKPLKQLSPSARVSSLSKKISSLTEKATKKASEFIQPQIKELAESLKKGSLPDVIGGFIDNVIPVKTRAQLGVVLQGATRRLMGAREEIYNKYNVQFVNNDFLDNASDFIGKLRENSVFSSNSKNIPKLRQWYNVLEQYNKVDYDVHALSKIKTEAAEQAAKVYTDIQSGGGSALDDLELKFYQSIADGARRQIEGVHPEIAGINKEYAAVEMARMLNSLQEAISMNKADPGFLREWGRAGASLFASQGYQAIEVSRLMMKAAKTSAKRSTTKIFNLGQKLTKATAKRDKLLSQGVKAGSTNFKGVEEVVKRAASTKIKSSVEGNK